MDLILHLRAMFDGRRRRIFLQRFNVFWLLLHLAAGFVAFGPALILQHFGDSPVDLVMALMYVNPPAPSFTEAGLYAETKFSHLMFI